MTRPEKVKKVDETEPSGYIERLAANAKVTTVLDLVQHPPTQWNLRGGQMKQC